METKFKTFIEKQKLCQFEDKILLTVSGGIDSIVMLDLFVKAGYSCSIAHCNFKLRGKESDEDEKFVCRLAAQYKIPFFTKSFHTSEISKEKNISIQMAARELRYKWFEMLRKKHHFKYIAVAHNANDSIETFFINLTRGTGITGLTGIAAKSDKIIRPLLFAFRKDIVTYCKKNELQYREDSSNNTTKYARNLIRHELIPLLKRFNPSFENTMIENISKLYETEQIFSDVIAKTKNNLLKQKGKQWLIEVEKIKMLNPIKTYLYEIFKDFEFNKDQAEDIHNLISSQTGKYICSDTHTILRNRNNLIVEKNKNEKIVSKKITIKTKKITLPVSLCFKICDADKFQLIKDNHTACLDFNKITFPLELRKWKQGDYFYPLGMKGKKKISDFFTDKKLSLYDKNNTWLLTSGDSIVWVTGMQIDERFKITDRTKKVWVVQLGI